MFFFSLGLSLYTTLLYTTGGWFFIFSSSLLRSFIYLSSFSDFSIKTFLLRSYSSLNSFNYFSTIFFLALAALYFSCILSCSTLYYSFWLFRVSISSLLSLADLLWKLWVLPLIEGGSKSLVVVWSILDVFVDIFNLPFRSFTFAFKTSICYALPFQAFSSERTASISKFSPISLAITLLALFSSFLRVVA